VDGVDAVEVDVVVVVVVEAVAPVAVDAVPAEAVSVAPVAAGVAVVAVVDVVVVSSTTFGASVVAGAGFSSLAQPAATRSVAETAPRATIERNFFMTSPSSFERSSLRSAR
jgi:hypothetical protein